MGWGLAGVLEIDGRSLFGATLLLEVELEGLALGDRVGVLLPGPGLELLDRLLRRLVVRTAFHDALVPVASRPETHSRSLRGGRTLIRPRDEE